MTREYDDCKNGEVIMSLEINPLLEGLQDLTQRVAALRRYL